MPISVLLTIASIAFQSYQQKRAERKARRAAEAAAEARRGFEFVVEGQIQSLNLVYGRNKIGGNRVYHRINSNFYYDTPNSDKIFKTVGLDETANGEKNEYLIFQQAICQGPIGGIHDVLIEESTTINDEVYARDGAAMRIDCHYGDSTSCAIATANDFSRDKAKFPNAAYATCVIKLNRDEPQFGGPPELQFLIEGKLIKKITRSGVSPNYTYELNASAEYTNNPAYCLLDYLLNVRKLDITKIDLESFYNSAQICDTVVFSDAVVGGLIYQNTDLTRDITNRDLPLYECNLVLDTTKPLRENVEAILGTMGDARLVWSQGVYKLVMQYPDSNANINLAGTITDDDLVHAESIKINYPGAEKRFNHITVRFRNETRDFKEDTASWPSKTGGTEVIPIGTKRYNIKSGWTDQANIAIRDFLNNYAVWETDDGSAALHIYKIYIETSGDYTLKYGAQASSADISLHTLSNQSMTYAVNSTVLTLVEDTEYTITINGGASSEPYGVAASLETSDGNIVWTTRDPIYTAFETKDLDGEEAIYNAFLAEDNGLELESDFYEEGITDWYHATAKAEELVRTSRTSFTIEFNYIVKTNYYEPGDFVFFDSSELGLQYYLRIENIELDADGTAKVNASRFDYTYLAWNVNDNEYIKPKSIYDFTIPVPNDLTFTAGSGDLVDLAGLLTWSPVLDSAVRGYALYRSSDGLAYTEMGRTSNSLFNVPGLNQATTYFGIRSYLNDGTLSNIYTIGPEDTSSTTVSPGATRNKVFRQATAPTTPPDDIENGDIWINDFVVPELQYIRIGGEWILTTSLGGQLITPQPFCDPEWVVPEYCNDTSSIAPVVGTLNPNNADNYIESQTINTPHIADLAIGSAQIADLAVVQAKIGLAAIGTAQIDDAAITSAKIEDAAITSAKIGEAEITTAKIGTAQIDTLRVANNAITDLDYTWDVGPTNKTYAQLTSGTTLVSAVVTKETSGPLFLDFTAELEVHGTGTPDDYATYVVKLALKRNTTEIYSINLQGSELIYHIAGTLNSEVTGIGKFLTEDPAATYTYYLEASIVYQTNCFISDIDFSNVLLTALEAKR